MAPKKPRLVWGIILASLGLFGIFNLSDDALFVMIWVVFMLVGGLLIFLYIRSVRKYKLLQEEEFNTRVEGEKLERTRRSVERSVLEMEQARIKAETDRIKGVPGEVKVCSACGAAGKGKYCEYCGRKL